MDALIQATISVPFFQTALLLVLSTIALLLDRLKLALLFHYIFILYWGYVSNRAHLLGEGLEILDSFSVLYGGFGIAIVILAGLGFLFQK